MKTVTCLLSALTIAAASLTFCSPSFAAPPQSSSLTIENHQKLVTVKDGNGVWIFSQVISTPNLKVSQVSLGKELSRIILQDGTGKPLWSKTINYAILDGDSTPHGEWSDKFYNAVLPMMSSLGSDASGTLGSSECKQIDFVIGSDDQLVRMHVNVSKHSLDVAPVKNGFVAELDGGKKTLVVLQPPAPAAAPTVAQASAP